MWDIMLDNIYRGLAVENESRAGQDLEPLSMEQYIKGI